MNYINESCSICQKLFTAESDVVVCPDCGTPYHRACYHESGECVHEAEHSTGFVWKPLQKEKPVQDKKEAMPASELHKQTIHTTLPNTSQSFQSLSALQENLFETLIEKARQNKGERLIDGYTQKEVATVIGKDAFNYLPYFHQSQNDKKMLTFNWNASVGGVFYALYRKIYKLAIPLLILFTIFFTITSFTYLKNLPLIAYEMQMYGAIRSALSSGSFLLDTISNFAFWLYWIGSFISGFFANNLYKKKVYGVIEETRKKEEVNMPSYFKELSRKGGTTRKPIFLFLLIFVIIYFVLPTIILFTIMK